MVNTQASTITVNPLHCKHPFQEDFWEEVEQALNDELNEIDYDTSEWTFFVDAHDSEDESVELDLASREFTWTVCESGIEWDGENQASPAVIAQSLVYSFCKQRGIEI